MKCVEELSTGKVTRINDTEAQARVNNKTHQYVSKTVWKKKTRDTGKKSEQ